jgi:hypothetical protein
MKVSWDLTRLMFFMCFCLFLVLEQLALTGVAAAALGENVLAFGLDRLPGDHPTPDGSLDGQCSGA